MSSSHSKTNLFKPNHTNLSKADKKFDPKYLTAQQHSYLVELQSIYNELNGSNINIFKSTTTAPPKTHSPPHTSSSLPYPLTNKKPSSLSKKSIFKSDLHIPADKPHTSNSNSSNSHIKNKLDKEKSVSTNQLIAEKTSLAIQKSNLLIEQQQQLLEHYSSLKQRIKSTLENPRRKSLPEFNSTNSLNLQMMTPPVTVHILDGHRSLGPSSLKKKTVSTQSLSSKTLAQPILLPPLPTFFN